MAERQINPVLKQVLELGPPLFFFGFYLLVRDQTYTVGGIEYDGFIVAAAVFVPVLLLAMGVLWALTGTLSRMQIVTAVMVIVFGGMTVWFNDDRFFKMKTTIVYAVVAGLLGIGLLQGKSYLEWALGQMLPMEAEGWMILTRRLALLFAVLAVTNEIVWRTMSDDAWVAIETFAFPGVLLVFLFGQIMALQRYLIEDEPDQSGS